MHAELNARLAAHRDRDYYRQRQIRSGSQGACYTIKTKATSIFVAMII